MTVLLAVILATLHLELDYFVAFYQRINYLSYYLCTFYGWCSHRDCSLVVDEQNLVKFNSLTLLGILYPVDKELLTLLGFELLTVDFYNCVHCLIIV